MTHDSSDNDKIYNVSSIIKYEPYITSVSDT